MVVCSQFALVLHSPKLEPKRRGSDMVPQRAHSQQVKRPSLPVTPQNPRKASDASSRSGSMSTPSRVHGKRPASGTSESSLNPVFEARAQLLNDADDLMTDRFEEAQYAAAAAAPGSVLWCSVFAFSSCSVGTTRLWVVPLPPGTCSSSIVGRTC